MPPPLLSPFQESLNAILKARQREEKDRADEVDAFNDAWKKLRRETINPVLEEAAQFLRGVGINALVKNENGDTTSLVAGRCVLVFSADSSKLKISCSCPPVGPEDFDTGKLSRAQVEDKVREFAKIVEF